MKIQGICKRVTIVHFHHRCHFGWTTGDRIIRVVGEVGEASVQILVIGIPALPVLEAIWIHAGHDKNLRTVHDPGDACVAAVATKEFARQVDHEFAPSRFIAMHVGDEKGPWPAVGGIQP